MWRTAVIMACLELAGCQGAMVPVVSGPQEVMPFCTRTLGVAECFANPSALLDRPTGLGDIPVRTHPAPAPWWRVL